MSTATPESVDSLPSLPVTSKRVFTPISSRRVMSAEAPAVVVDPAVHRELGQERVGVTSVDGVDHACDWPRQIPLGHPDALTQGRPSTQCYAEKMRDASARRALRV
jgi:hypothetical protein